MTCMWWMTCMWSIMGASRIKVIRLRDGQMWNFKMDEGTALGNSLQTCNEVSQV